MEKNRVLQRIKSKKKKNRKQTTSNCVLQVVIHGCFAKISFAKYHKITWKTPKNIVVGQELY